MGNQVTLDGCSSLLLVNRSSERFTRLAAYSYRGEISMADNASPVNYEDVLADLRAKKEKLEAAICGIEVMLGIPSLGSYNAAATTQSKDVEADSFFGLSIPEAARKYLGMQKKTQSTQEIAAALERGGLTHQSGNFGNTVGSVLARIDGAGGDIVKLARATWGLAAWYPNARRKKVANNKAVDVEEEQGESDGYEDPDLAHDLQNEEDHSK